MQSQILEVSMSGSKHFFFAQYNLVLCIVLIISKYLHCQFLMLAAERNHFRRHDRLIAEMRIVVSLGFKEPVFLS